MKKLEIYEHTTIFEMRKEKDVKNYFYHDKEWKLIEIFEDVISSLETFGDNHFKFYTKTGEYYYPSSYKFKLINEETK